MKHSMRGVTLIELMVVLAISAILMGIWVSQVTASKIKEANRAKTAAAFNMLQRPKIAVLEHFLNEGEFPLNNEDAHLPSPEVLAGIDTESIEIKDGAIHITLKKGGPQSLEKVLSFRPAVLKAEPYGPYVTWVCGNQKEDPRLIIQGLNRTNIENQYLPQPCRGTNTNAAFQSANADD